MKTIVSVITGRKDFPIFKGSDEDIIKHLSENEWQMCDVAVLSDGSIEVKDECQERDNFEIVNVEFIEL